MEKKKLNILVKYNFRDIAVYIAFVAFFLLFTITLKDVGKGFADIGNLMNVLRQTCLLAIMSVGMSFVISAGQIDLSIGNIVGVTSIIASYMVNNYGIFVGVLTSLIFGIIAGAINGMLIAYFKLPPFIATLGMSTVWQGASRSLSGLKAIAVTNKRFISIFGGGNVGIIPSVFIWMTAVVFIGYIIMNKTRIGRKVLAVGGNQRAAYYSGIKVEHIRILVMIIAGFLAALAGILWTGRFGGGRYSLGETSGASVIAATVFGGTSMGGGKSSIFGGVVGAVLFGMLDTALIMYGLDTHQQMIVSGIAILIAVAVTIPQKGTK